MEKKVAKIIFLDFDGVLNTEYHQRQLQFEGKIWQELSETHRAAQFRYHRSSKSSRS